MKNWIHDGLAAVAIFAVFTAAFVFLPALS